MKITKLLKLNVHNHLRSIFLLCAILYSGQFFAQSKIAQIDAEFQRLVEKGALTIDQASNYMITAQHTSKISGIEHIYFNQAINGLIINGTESSIHLFNGKKIKFNENLLLGDAFRVNGSSSPSITAEQAIRSISQTMRYNISDLNEIEKKSGPNQETIFNNAGISKKEIPTKLAYQLTENKEVKLIWEVIIEDINSNEDWWVFAVNASNGSIISKYNLYESCNITDEHNDHFHSGVSPNIEKINNDKVDYSAILKGIGNKATNQNESSLMVGTYNVYAMPDESPHHGSAGRTLVANPDGAGSPFGWHDTNGANGAESTLTTGNNVDAHKGTTRSDGGASLVFNTPVDLNQSPTTTNNILSATTNLFYWNNIIHDVLWVYGFDEAARNFQENNYGNGGAGGDSVNANCQASGNCNANFGTPSDGGNPTMNMFICDIANPDRDGDFDNGVIIHEYGHGISNRLTGGASVSCLNNSEQMGEGWSDFYGLIMTIQSGDAGTDARGIGTWLLGEGPNGAGIRTDPYSTDMSIYTQTYSDVNGAVVPHGVGEIWANMLWEMTWGLIADHGIDSDIYNFTGDVNLDKGNVMAFALVTEGLKLQPCSPGFVDGRDAILAADVALYGGANACTIWDAFAKRGLGFSASQGSSGSTSDGTEAFDLPPNTAAFSSTLSSICVTQGSQTGLGGGTPSGGTYTGNGVSDNGDGTFDFDPTVGGPGNTTVTYTVLDGCSGAVVALDDTIVVTDGLPALVCQDVTVVLDGGGNAVITESDVISNILPGVGYTIDQSGTFAPIDMTGSTSLSLGDDDSASAAIPFGFIFFQNTFTSVNIGSNGYLSFSGSGLTEFVPDALPDANAPQNVIAAVWDDLNPNDGGTIHYKVSGTAPSRIFVVEYLNLPHYSAGGGSTNLITTQVQLHEGTNVVEIHTTRADSDGGNRTQGIENAAGDEAYTPSGRNLIDWNLANGSSDYVAFIPNAGGLPDNCGFSVSASLSQTAFTCQDIGDVIVTVTADDGNGGITTCDATVTIQGPTSTFNGGWDVAPGPGSKAIFQSNYNTATNGGSVTACSCEIESGATVTVGAGEYLDINGNILVDGVLDVQHEGSVVQRSATATATNNGTITVRKTTPVLGPKGFMLLGNPMSGETREGVYGGARQVINHITGNFIPNSNVNSGLENFVDDNGDNLAVHSGSLTPAEGYIVKPQAPGNPPVGGSFPLDYTLGTLNTGDVTYNLLFNGTRLNSPNMLGNPYASAIDIDLFLGANPLVDAIYYWEHITAPVPNFPGFNQLNFNIGDISAYNQGSGGVMAPNGTTIPTKFMASGQGFGVKALGGGTVTFTNAMRVESPNTDYRTNNSDRQRIWLDLKNETYNLKSNMLVAFTESATDGFEGLYDSRRFDSAISLYSVLDTEEQLCIQGRTAFNEEQVVDLGFATMVEELQTYTISINQIEGTDISNATVYLEDHLLNITTNLSDGNYTFTSEEGQQLNRFKLVFQERVLSNNDVALQNISMLPNPTSGMLVVNSPNADVHQIEVIDVQGRIVSLKQYANNNQYLVDLSSLESAMYFVKLYTSEGTLIKRVIRK